MSIAELLSRIAAHDFLRGTTYLVCPGCERILEDENKACPRCGSFRKVRLTAL